jgi:hypothetical protein
MAATSKARLRVFLVPTTSYQMHSQGCDLSKIASALTAAQDSFEFIVIVRTDGSRLEITKNQSLKFIKFNESQRLSVAEVEEALGLYVVDLDAFEQINEFLNQNVNGGLKDYDLAAAICSRVYVPDVSDNEFFGDEKDAYSCLGSGISILDINNNHNNPYRNIAVISLARLSIVYPEAWDSNKEGEEKRAIISRYIIANIAHLLAGRMFAEDLDRNHQAMCVAESNYFGGERASYHAKGLCQECEQKVMTPQIGLADKYKGRLKKKYKSIFKRREIKEPVRVVKAINEVTCVAEKIDNKIKRKATMKRRIELAGVVVFAGLTAALLAGYSKGQSVFDYSIDHYIAVSIAFVSVLLVIYYKIIMWRIDKSLP